VVEYEIGCPLETWLDRLFVGPQMRSTFRHRQRTLEQLLAGSPRTAVAG
jgi:hypothetical protein